MIWQIPWRSLLMMMFSVKRKRPGEEEPETGKREVTTWDLSRMGFEIR